MSWNEITETYGSLPRRHLTLSLRRIISTPYDAILSNPDTDPHTPRMIAADGIHARGIIPSSFKTRMYSSSGLWILPAVLDPCESQRDWQLAYSNPALRSSTHVSEGRLHNNPTAQIWLTRRPAGPLQFPKTKHNRGGLFCDEWF